MTSDPLVRPNLNDGVAQMLRQHILQGRFAPGERLNEVELAAKLGVSRTPIREALNRLVVEGSVDVRPRLGYAVRPLSLEEFDGLYDIRPMLDPQALWLAGIPDESALEQLDHLNERLQKASDPVERIDLDDTWHHCLIARCPNATLIELIDMMMKRTRRYELAYLKDSRNAATACDLHARIVLALRQADLAGACDWLRENLSNGKPAIEGWLRAHIDPSAGQQ